MKIPSTMDEYTRLVDEALIEIDNLREAIEFDDDETAAAQGFVENLATMVRDLRQQMATGSYTFSDRDLPFMELISAQSNHFLPFKNLLETINRTHRQGLRTAGE